MIRRGIGIQSFVSAGGGGDADAQAFITAAGITDATQQSAINTLVTDLKGYGIWSKMKAIYPMVGGTSSTHKWNLKDPRDLDAAFRLVFSGGGTHSSTGYQPNGVNSYADTKLNPSGLLNANDISMSIYSRTNTNGVFCDMGASQAGTSTGYQYSLYTRLTDVLYTDLGSQSAGRITYANTDSRGHFISSRTSSTSFKAYKNSELKATLTTSQTQSLLSRVLFLGAINDSGGTTQYSNRELAFAHIGDGLTDTEAANFYTSVQKYQTTLGRHVGVPIVADSDAQAFLNAAVIEDQVQATAINTLVTDLKGYGIWTKMKAIYPMVGGTSSTHKWNLKDPRDLDAAFRLVFSGGWTHSSTGALPNGTNGYADTKLLQNTFDNNSVHLSMYSRSNTSINSFDIGGNSGAPNFQGAQLTAYYTSIGAISHLHSYPTDSAVSSSFTDTRAFYLGSRNSSTSNKLYRNSSLLTTNTTARTSTLPSVNFRLASDGIGFTNRQFAFASIGDGLTDTEAANLYTAVQAYQTTLSRNV